MPRVRHRTRQRQPLVIHVARRQHHRTGPCTRQQTQRLQRRIQPPLCRDLQCKIGGVRTHPRLQRPHFTQRRISAFLQPQAHMLRQQRIQLPADPAADVVSDAKNGPAIESPCTSR